MTESTGDDHPSRPDLDDEDDLNSVQRSVLRALSLEDSGVGSAVPAFPSAGDRLGDFVLEREIGRGAMGVVFRAQQAGVERPVALKIIPAHGMEATDRRIEREALLLGRLRHRSLITVHAAGRQGPWHYLAMDLVEGGSLRDRIEARRGSRGDLAFAVGALRSVAEGLAEAHRAGVVHRDVKPANILLDPEGRASLGDFGLAREDPRVTEQTATVGFVGTPRYASPEQVRGEPLTPASDVFSLGVTLFETIVGAPPFSGDSAKLLDAIQHAPPNWPSQFRCPRDLVAILGCCLEKRAADRYRDAGQLEEDLGRFLRFEPVLAEHPGPLVRVWRRALLRPRRAAAVVGAVLLLMALGFAVYLAGDRGASLLAQEKAERLFAAQDLLLRGEFEIVESELSRWTEDQDADAPVEAMSWLGLARLFGDAPTSAEPCFRGRESDVDRLGLALVRGEAPVDVLRPAILVAEPTGEPGSSPVSTPATGLGSPASSADPMVLALWARVFLREGSPGAAVECLQTAVDRAPRGFFYRVELADALFAAGRTEAGVQSLQIARALRPDALTPALRLAEGLFLLYRFDEAETVLETANVLHPGSPELLSLIAQARASRYLEAEAVAAAREALELAPQNPRVRFETIHHLISAGQLTSAAEVLEDFQDPNDAYAVLARARIAAARDDTTRSLALAEGLIADRSARKPIPRPGWTIESAARAVRVTALRSLGRFDEALEEFVRLEALEPANPNWPWQRGHVLMDLGRSSEAEVAVAKAMSQHPENAELQALWSRVLFVRGDQREAVLQMIGALGLARHDARIHFRMSEIWFDLEEPTVALFHLLIALEQSPRWFDARVLAARCYAMCGYHAEALVEYKKALEVDDHAAVRADYAELLHRTGQESESLRQYEQAALTDPALASAKGGEALLRMTSQDPSIRDPARAARLLEEVLATYPGSPFYEARLREARAMVALPPPSDDADDDG